MHARRAAWRSNMRAVWLPYVMGMLRCRGCREERATIQWARAPALATCMSRTATHRLDQVGDAHAVLMLCLPKSAMGLAAGLSMHADENCPALHSCRGIPLEPRIRPGTQGWDNNRQALIHVHRRPILTPTSLSTLICACLAKEDCGKVWLAPSIGSIDAVMPCKLWRLLAGHSHLERLPA